MHKVFHHSSNLLLVNTCMYYHIHAYTIIYVQIQTEVFLRIWYVFGVRICTYPCLYLHVLHVFVHIQFMKKC
jgi:hypothetical protein